MPNDAPIGIFDSGVGGLTVARAIAQLLPRESFIYFGDTAHLPYGDKSEEAIKTYSLNIAQFLIDQGCKAIVVACNTASAVAYDVLVSAFGQKLPILNVLDPVAEAVALRKHSTIGVIGTRATIKSQAYSKRIKALNNRLEVQSLATPLLVPIIEEGLTQSSISTEVLLHYLQQPELQQIDALILGCTHYPILHREIESHLPDAVQVIDSPQIVAEMVSQVLAANNLLATRNNGEKRFYVSDYTETFARIARHFFGVDVALEEMQLM